jgi:hypothetical protein
MYWRRNNIHYNQQMCNRLEMKVLEWYHKKDEPKVEPTAEDHEECLDI